MKKLKKQVKNKIVSVMLLMLLVLQSYSPILAAETDASLLENEEAVVSEQMTDVPPDENPKNTEKENSSPGMTKGIQQSKETDAYSSSLNFATDQKSFYGGEIITFYNNVSVSGNQTELEEGSYTLVYLPKSSFQKPKETDISTNFDLFKALEITETEDNYVIKTTYKTIYGGYVGGTPIRVNLLSSQTVNLSEHLITQEFYNVEGEKLTPASDLKVGGLARIETLGSRNFSTERLIAPSIDENYVIKEGFTRDFYVYSYFPGNNANDPRDRRIYAQIPEEATVVGTDWKYDAESDRYYKDVPRKFSDTTQNKITLAFTGFDMSSYNASNNYKSFRVNYSIQPVVDGVPQTDLGPHTAYCSRNFYILEQEPPPQGEQGAYNSWSTSKYNKVIGKDYKSIGTTSLGTTNSTYISYNPDELDSQRIRYSHKNISSWYHYNPKDDADTRELIIESSQVYVSSYTKPSELRIMLTGLSGDDLAFMQEKLQGTKAYGVAADGTKTLLSKNVPVVSHGSYSNSFDNQGWSEFTGGENYRSIIFEYPDGGVLLKGETEINKYKYTLWTEVIADIKPSTYETLKGLLDSNKTPQVYTNDYAYTWVTSKYKRMMADEEITVTRSSRSAYTNDYFRMQYETITLCNNVHVTNGSQFFSGDIVSTRLGYYHNRYGNFSQASNPENINIYYLVPDGLEPVEDSTNFSSIKIMRGYSTGYNLIIAKPKITAIPSLDGSINRTTQNRYELDFTATERLQVGTYRIYSSLSIDNNKIGVRDGKQYGILQFDTPSGLWSNITKDANNRPDDNTKYTNMGTTSFTIYPPKVLSSIKYVKLSSDPDTKYASSLGQKGSVGDAIDYRWLFKNNSPKEIDSMIVIDILPYNGDTAIVPSQKGEYLSRGSTFKTPLVSVDDHAKFDFYYSIDSVKPTTQENANATWLTEAEVDDMSQVTMIKAVLKEGQKIEIGEEIYIHTHNFIENDSTILDGEKAYNSFALSLNNGNTFVEALKVEVEITYPKRDIRLEKRDLNNPNLMLYNAVFSVYEVGGAEDGSDLLVLDDVKTNYDGIATLPNLLVGKEYYLIEKEAPEGYAKTEEKIYFTVETETDENPGAQILEITNDIPRVNVSGIKIWDDGDDVDGVRPKSITLHLYKKKGGEEELVQKKKVVPDAEGNWKWRFSNLPKFDGKEPIVYIVREVEVGAGYRATIRGDANKGYTITNTRIPLAARDTNGNNPKTGDSSELYLWLTLMLSSIGGGLIAVHRKSQRKE